MSEIYLLDTNVLADFFNGLQPAVEFVDGLKPKQAAISVVTYTEILIGFDHPSQERDFDALVDSFLYFSIEKSTAKIAAQLKKQHRWKLPDAYQAAVAVEHDLILLTRNTKDFDPKIHKFVKIPYRLR